jgi:hypothetical protein
MAEPGESASGTRKHYILSKERNIISNVIQGFVKECEEGRLLHPITTPVERAYFYTGGPRRMILRIKRERENNSPGTPGKYASEQDMVDWLRANGLVDISMRKTVLYDFIEKLKPPEKNLQDRLDF